MKRSTSPGALLPPLAVVGALPASRATTLLLLLCLAVQVGVRNVVAEEPKPTKSTTVPAAEPPLVERALTDDDRDHWAFRPLARPAVPVVKRVDWPRTPVDRFILSRLEQKGLTPSPTADRLTLLRRLAFDLTGLPPSPEEQRRFVADTRPDAYEQLVDRLLASRAHAERWAQHWLDLARFAETDGFEHDRVRPDVWKYRDWVIDALHADMPYDRFVTMQLAGDELGKDGSAIPTMFCLSGPDMPDMNDQLERRHNRLNETTATVGAVLLGLQFGCAQCHDHKYDPISQGDFYRLRAVFEPSVPVMKRDVPVLVLGQHADVPAARLWLRGDHRRPAATVAPAFPRIAVPEGRPIEIERAARPRTELAKWLFDEANPLTARVMANRLWQHHFGRGLCLTPNDLGVLQADPTHSELLDFLASEMRMKNWSMKEMHRLIVCSATYRQVSRRADEEAASVWNARRVADPEGELYSRFPRRRLDGESLRDALLSVSGLLNEERGGPGVMPPLPVELTGTLLKGQWTTSPNERDHYRRSVYLFARRNLRYPLFDAFDRPDANASCAVRSHSTTAPQSLLLLNGELSLLVARHVAGRVLRDAGSVDEQADQLLERLYQRPGSAAERQTLRDYLRSETAKLRAASPTDRLELPPHAPPHTDGVAAQALVTATLAALNANAFVYVD